MIILLWGSAAVVAVTLSTAVFLWVRYAPTAARGLADMPWLPDGAGTQDPGAWDEVADEAEEVAFQTADGLRLAASYLPATTARRRGVVIFCHELYGSRRTAVAFAGGLRRQGFDLLAFDFRNHGASQRKPGYEPLPWVTRGETADVRAAIDYCCRRDPGNAGRLVLFGLSRGAATALCVASRDPRVKLAVLDSICPTERVQIYMIRRFMNVYARSAPLLSRFPDWLLSLLVFWARLIIQRRRRCRLVHVERAARRMRRPVLLIHGERDPFVPPQVVRALRERMPNCPRLWVVPGAKHNRTVCTAGDDYRRRVARFLVQHLDVPRGLPSMVAEPVPMEHALADRGSNRDGAPLPC